MASPATQRLKRREVGPAAHLPYLSHATEHVVTLATRALITCIRIEGVSFETADPAELNDLHAKLNLALRNVADERLALWTHVVRRRSQDYPTGRFRSGFARDLDAAYRERLTAQDLYRNDLTLTLVWHPGRDRAERAIGLLARLGRARAANDELDTGALKKLEDATRDVVAALAPYGPSRLGLYERDGVVFSQVSEFLHELVSGEPLPVPLIHGPIGPALYTNRLIFGREAIEIRGAGRSHFAGMFGLKEYPATTRPGLLDGLLAAPMELVVTHSFAFLSKHEAKAVMTRKQNQLLSSNDPAASQIGDLDTALDDLESGRFVMGDHHVSVLVRADSPAALLETMARGRRILADAGAVVAREDLGLEAAYWAQCPGLFRYRARAGAITSRNFAALSPFHTYPSGRADGIHWGAAVACLKTASGAPYHFSFHVGDLGNTFVCGPSGSGKTVFIAFALAQAEKLGCQLVLFDKDRGAELAIRALGGTYLALRSGHPTGCAPLKRLELTPENLAFLGRLVRQLVSSEDRPLSTVDEGRIDAGLLALRDLPREERSFSALRVFLGQRDPEGIGARLERWCQGGPLGWVLDNDADAISLDASTLGFDMTEVLDDATVRTPLMMVLFHRVEDLIDGRRILIAIDEFWKALGDEAFRALANDGLKTIRKKNGAMLFGTQSPRDALASPIAHTIVEQCPTQVFFPNPRGQAADYIDGFHLSRREYRLVKEDLSNESRRFLVKQGRHAVVAELDLSGLEDHLAVLSGRTATVELLDRLRAEMGDEPATWLPAFHAQRRTLP
ncbi:VirB4 family type IV secretion/conjugal transfer ATPase [Methylobacterium sp. C25]|uniref:VirB4 family type IV secretion/conjugal transfer ATPase n=1 Tax=Methylobacterium sp. C25 TaxID=2721622 RepID=UPI001F3D6677|nr:VirB4 family type IV secretion system protein [Methylobacterium sp. C25]MCE4226360.1 VirB4 family type IV secretion/conjugal transfer ATPase [Methylobacterium sp. C25]